jgi:hypothetical protein
VRILEETASGRAAREAVALEIEKLFASDWDEERRAVARKIIAVFNILIETLQCN